MNGYPPPGFRVQIETGSCGNAMDSLTCVHVCLDDRPNESGCVNEEISD